MPSAYPGALDNWPTTRTDATAMATNHKDDHDNANDSINKIEAELGVLPKGNYTDVKTRLDTLERPPFNAQSGTTYTLVLADAAKTVRISNASAIVLTVPLNANVAFAVGTQIQVVQAGAGQITLTPASGVTLQSRGAAFKTAGQYAYALLTKVATDTWELSGDITT